MYTGQLGALDIELQVSSWSYLSHGPTWGAIKQQGHDAIRVWALYAEATLNCDLSSKAIGLRDYHYTVSISKVVYSCGMNIKHSPSKITS